MRIFGRVGLVLTLCLTTLALVGLPGVARGAAPKELRIGLLPAEDAASMIKQYDSIRQHLEGKLGIPVKVWVSQSYNALIEAMRADHIDLAYVGGSQYLAAKRQGIKVVPILVAINEDGRSFYYSVIFTHKDTGITSVKELKGKTFAFVEPTSTSGGEAPRYYLLKNGIDPDRDLKRYVYTQRHDAVIQAVIHKKVDAGATADLHLIRNKERGMFKEDEIRILAEIKVPGTPMIARGDLPADFLEKVKAAYKTIPKALLQDYKVWGKLAGFEDTSESDYLVLAEMQELLGKK